MINNINHKLHYYGWGRIEQSIHQLYINKNIVIIDYMDIYFLNHNVAVIEKNWIGIVHHTSSLFSNNNINNLFKNNIFLNSLKTCKGLVVLSEYNKINILNELEKLYLNIEVYVLKHPIPPTFNKKFDINLFEQNLDIYNIGGWMRNPYTIYHSNFCYNGNPINKHKLKGYSMDQYFPTDNIDYNNIVDQMVNSINLHIDMDMNTNIDYVLEYSHPNNFVNYYIKYLLEYIASIINNYNSSSYHNLTNRLIKHHNSVQIHNYLENDNYLDLLVSNIIFCDYIDCSASNTIVECIATCTPIILNRHPAIIEYLGDEYPLYFDKIYDVDTNTFNLTTENLQQACGYLYSINSTTELELNTFINNLHTIIKNNGGTSKKKKKKLLLL